jgi:hypothetical protein
LGEEGRRLTTWRGRDWRIEEEEAAEAEVREGGEEEEEAWWWGRRRSRPPASRQRRTRSASMADGEVRVRRKEGEKCFLACWNCRCYCYCCYVEHRGLG